MPRKKRWWAALVLLALVFFLPLLFNLEVLHEPVQRAVERQLGREIEFATLTARLLPRPGVVGRRVVVHEQEGFGAEPFLYAEEVHCYLSPRTLWAGRLEFSEIHFARASINLVRNSHHAWNFGALLLSQGAAPPSSPPASPVIPVLSVTAGRINFKLGADKQVYALTAARLRVEPRGEGRWQLQLEATPIRVDRRLTETGRLRLRGEVSRTPEFSQLPFRLEMGLERGSLGQLWTLFTGRQPSLRALASFAATLEGTPAEWKAGGTFTIANLRRWDLVAPPGSPRWQGEFRLKVLGREQAVEIENATLRSKHSALQVVGRVDDPFGRRRWRLQARAERLALGELMTQWAGLKANVSMEARLDATAEMALRVRGPVSTWQGELTAAEGATLYVPGRSPPVELGKLRLLLRRGRLELRPLTLRFSPAHTLTLTGRLPLFGSRFPYRLRWRSRSVELGALRETAAVFGWDLFGPTRWQGEARLDLEWRGEALRGGEPRWQGQVGLREASFQPPQFSRPLEIVQARLQWRGSRFTARPLVVRLGENTVKGSLERQGRAGRWKVSLAAKQVRLGDLNQLLNPAPRGLLARIVGPEPPPMLPWKELAAVGEIRVGELTAGPFRLRRLSARGQWESGWLELSRLRFRAYGGRFAGRLQSDFRTTPPEYRLAGNLKQVKLAGLLADSTRLGELFNGLVGADVALQTAGTNPRELLRHLRGRVVGVVQDGTIAHLNLLGAMSAAAGLGEGQEEVGTPTQLQSLAGEFRVAEEQVEFDEARLIANGAALELSGRVGFDGRLDLRLSGEPLRVAGRRPSPAIRRLLSASYRSSGTLRRPEVQLAEPLPPVVRTAR